MKQLIISSVFVYLFGFYLVFASGCSNQTAAPQEKRPATGKVEATTGNEPSEKARQVSRLPHQAPSPAAARLYEKSMSTADYSSHLPSPYQYGLNTEKYQHLDANPVQRVAEHPVSTFSIDVDTGSYANVRRMLEQGQLPPADAVRTEELINYFDYHYQAPADRDTPFKVSTEIAPTPWNRNTHLLRIGIKGYDVAKNKIPPANLVFLVDVSGSMRAPNKLELLKSSLTLLTKQLGRRDRISLVVYAGASGVVLEPTPGNQRAKIVSALNLLTAGGSTNGEEQNIARGMDPEDARYAALKSLIEDKRKSGISLTTLGFGMGNYNDQMMEQLADTGNGNYAYIDNMNEANKVLVQQMSSTLFTIAKDVKVQIEFNPAVVSEYRLVGYENRKLRREDFSNDRIDAGEIGAGHTVTALYEITLKGNATRIEPLRYGPGSNNDPGHSSELAFLRLRYKAPTGDKSKLIEWPLNQNDILPLVERASTDFRFAVAVAGFAELLRGGKQTGNFGYKNVLDLASNSRGRDEFGYRGEFIKLVNLAESLSGSETVRRN